MTTAPATDELPDRIKNRLLVACMMAIFLAALDQTIVAPALPVMAQQFDAWSDISWVVTAYLLVTTAVIPIYGKASDIYGRRPAMTVAISVFCAGSILCALATDILTLSLARGIQGLGGGGLVALSMSVIGDIFAPRERGRYQGYISGIYAGAAVLGPTLGGVLSDLFGWPSIFWINLPLGAVTLLVAFTGMRHLHHVARPHYLDLPGAALFVCGSSALVLAMSSGGNRWEWLSIQTLALIALAAIAWLALAFRVGRIEEALISREVVTDRVVILALIAAFFGFGTLIALSAYYPAYLQATFDMSATQSGFAAIPLLLGTAAGAGISGKRLGHVENYKLIPVTGLGFAAMVCSALAYWLGNLSPTMLALFLPVVSAGIGSLLPVSMIVVQNAVRRAHMGSVTSLMNFSRQLGAVMLVALFGVVLFHGHPAAMVPETGGAAMETAPITADRFSRLLGIAALTLALATLAISTIESRTLHAERR
jgi:MFS family permease